MSGHQCAHCKAASKKVRKPKTGTVPEPYTDPEPDTVPEPDRTDPEPDSADNDANTTVTWLEPPSTGISSASAIITPNQDQLETENRPKPRVNRRRNNRSSATTTDATEPATGSDDSESA